MHFLSCVRQLLKPTIVIQPIKQHIKMSNLSDSTVPLSEMLKFLNEFAPIETAESWDNVGLLIEPSSYVGVKRVLLTNDFTESVMEEALERNSNFVITYHPLIFAGLKRITQGDWKSRIISKCLEKSITVFSPHTSWDAAENGVNSWLIRAVSDSLDNVRPVIPNSKEPHLGAGKCAELAAPLAIKRAIEQIKKFSGLSHVHVALGVGHTMDSEISSVAVCAGSGSSVLKQAKADLFVTGEMSHHEVLDVSHRGTTCFLLNHSNSERYFLSEFKSILNSKFPDLSVDVANSDADPVRTY